MPATAQVSTTPDKAATVAAALVTVLAAFQIPTKLGLSPDQFAVLMGDSLMLLCAIRAWWEGTQLAEGGSVVDPAGAAGGAVVSILGSLDVMSQLGLTADQTVGLVSAVFANGAGVRTWLRTRANKAANSAPPPTAAAA